MARELRLGLMLGYWFADPPGGVDEQVAAAEDLGYASVWTAEAYGSDCFTPLAWHAARTQRIGWGTGIAQMSARTPTATAMTALTLDHLTGGRFTLGLGASGPQVVEGWYGQAYPRPLERTREYVDVVRQVLAREAPVSIEGRHLRLPLTGPGTTGLGKALKSITHPRRADLPIVLGAEGPKNVALAAEIADGWMPIFLSPKLDGFYRTALQEGFDRPGARRSWDDFEIPGLVQIVPDEDVKAAADFVRMSVGFYIGGMGARDTNFHADVFVRMGYEEVARDVQDLFLAGRQQEAFDRIPLELVEDVALVGPWDKIAEELPRWRATCVTTMLVSGPPDTLRRIADLI